MPRYMYCGKQTVQNNAPMGVRHCVHRQSRAAVHIREEILRAVPQEKGPRINGA